MESEYVLIILHTTAPCPPLSQQSTTLQTAATFDYPSRHSIQGASGQTPDSWDATCSQTKPKPKRKRL